MAFSAYRLVPAAASLAIAFVAGAPRKAPPASSLCTDLAFIKPSRTRSRILKTASCFAFELSSFEVGVSDSHVSEKLCPAELSMGDCWEELRGPILLSRPYVSTSLQDMAPGELERFLDGLGDDRSGMGRAATADPLWSQVKIEAKIALESEPQAGPQLYSLILSQPSLLEATATIVANEIETELMLATSLKNLFLEQLHPLVDHRSVSLDVMAAAMRSPSVGSALNSILFDRGLHALFCYRVGHRLWLAGRKGLAYYMQSTVSSKYSADIHPACVMGDGIYLHCGSGVVIGETAVVGDDVSILQGVTLGGTGKEAGDRHPKIGRGVILHDSSTVLGNITVGDGAVVLSKSIVTKPVPPLARVSGVPAKIKSYRDITERYVYPDDAAHLEGSSADTDREREGPLCPVDGFEQMMLADMGSLEKRMRSLYSQQWESDEP